MGPGECDFIYFLFFFSDAVGNVSSAEQADVNVSVNSSINICVSAFGGGERD